MYVLRSSGRKWSFHLRHRERKARGLSRGKLRRRGSRARGHGAGVLADSAGVNGVSRIASDGAGS